MGRPVLVRMRPLIPGLAASSRQRGAVLRHCQTIAFAAGRPVFRSQRMVVSRWLVTPTAAMDAGGTFSMTRPIVRATLRQMSSGSCSTQPGLGNRWGNSE